AESMLSRSQAELSRARDELQRAESSHTIAHLSYTRLAEVGKQRPGLVAQQEIDDAKSKDLVAEAQVSAAKSSVSAAEHQVQVSSADVQKIKTLFEYTRVTAPFSGVVTRRYADTGAMIQAGISSSTQAMPLVKLSEKTLLSLIFPVAESAVPTVHVGQALDMTPENRIESRKLQLGAQTETKIEVKSGLREGELVVTGSRANIKPGHLVRPKLAEIAAPPSS